MTPGAQLKHWLDISLGFIYPPVCQICSCERATSIDGFVCRGCTRKVRFVEPPFCDRCGLPFDGAITTTFECTNCRDMDLHFSSARSAVLAREPLLDVIHRYKYQQALWFEPFLAGLFVGQAAPVLAQSNWDTIVPVPLYSTRQRERGFNQAERLAHCLSRATKIPVNTGLLRRITPTPSQTRLSRSERAANVEGAFARRGQNQHVRGRRVVLVDDVFTTGATTSACARELRAAGAADVCVWTLARGI